MRVYTLQLHRIWRPVAALSDLIVNQFRSQPAESSLQNNETENVEDGGDAETTTPAPDTASTSATAGPQNENQTKEEEENEEGMWEETFKTHTDTKPYGKLFMGFWVELRVD